MKLSECKHGVLIVQVKGLPHETYTVVGMVVGITQNCMEEAIPLVQFQDNLEPYGVHPDNLSLYEE